MDTIIQIFVIILLTFFEGVFVAAEIALVTIRRTRIDQLAEEGNRAAKRVKHLIAQPGRFLAVTQIGLTFLGFLASARARFSSPERLRRPTCRSAPTSASCRMPSSLTTTFSTTS